MIDSSTDFYKYFDNFAKYEHVGWHCVCGNEALLHKVAVTISIPTYNRPDTLKDAIDSALAQDGYNDYCVVVVDNDPENGTITEQLINSYHSEKLIYFKNDENIGMFGNQNRCFEIPKSEYVLLLHDDDLLFPNYLRECTKLLNNNDIDCLQPYKIKWNEGKEELDKIIIPPSNKKARRLYDVDNYLSFIPGTQSGGIFKRDAIISVGGYNSEYYPTADYCMGIQLMKQYKFYTYSDYLAIYRVGRNASMNQDTLKLFVSNDYFLRKQIFRKLRIPKFVETILLNYVVHRQVEVLRNRYNQNFTFDFSSLSIDSDYPKFFYIPFRIFSLIILIITRLILHYRQG